MRRHAPNGHSNLIVPPLPLPHLPVGGRLVSFVNVWEEIDAESWVLSTIRKGLRLQFITRPPLTSTPIPVSLPVNPERRQVLLDELHKMLTKGAVEIVSHSDLGYYSHLFAVTKKSGGWRPVIDLKRLNKMIVCPHFKMETAHSIRSQLRVGEWVVLIDLSDAYYHLLVHPKFRKFLRIHVLGTTFQFRAMCFGLCTAPLIFTRVMKSIAQFLRSRSINIHMYLDDWLIRAPCPDKLLSDAQYVLDHVSKLGCLINAKSRI